MKNYIILALALLLAQTAAAAEADDIQRLQEQFQKQHARQAKPAARRMADKQKPPTDNGTVQAAAANDSTSARTVSAATPQAADGSLSIREQLRIQQERIVRLEGRLERLLEQQETVIRELRGGSAAPPATSGVSPATSGVSPASPGSATAPSAPAEKAVKQEKKIAVEKTPASNTSSFGNFRFTGDIRLRYEPMFQEGGFITRHRERVRARFGLFGNLTDEVSGGLALATGSPDDINSTNQSLTGYFSRKPIAFDRYYLAYKPKWLKPLTLTGGKFAYTWYRTGLTFDSDTNPEGFSQTLSFNIKNDVLKNVTLVGFELPLNENGSGHDSFILGGQLQTRLKLGNKLGVRLYAAGVNFNRADSVAVAIGNGTLRPGLPNTNRLAYNSAGQVTGFANRFLYLDLISAVDYNWKARWPITLQVDFVNNLRASRERSGYWADFTIGRLAEQGDVQVGYSLVRIEREAVIGAFNESDLRSSTNVRNHRVSFGYQTHHNLQFNYSLWLGKLANPQDNASLVPVSFRGRCSSAPFTGCSDSFLKRMQVDLTYKF